MPQRANGNGTGDRQTEKPSVQVPGPPGKPAPKMRYVPPPAPYGAESTSAPPSAAASGKGASAGSMKMKYVAPPTNGGEWSRPKVTSKN